MKSALKTAVKGTTIVLFGMVASTILWLAARIIIVRVTTEEELGLYSLAIAVVSLSVPFALVGVNSGVARYVSLFLGEGRRDEVGPVTKAALQISLISAGCFFLLLFSLSGPIARYVFYKPEFRNVIMVISLALPFSIITETIVGILVGHKIIKPKSYYMDIGHPLFFIIFLGIFLFFGLPFISIIYAYVFAFMVSFVLIAVAGYRTIGLRPFALRGGGHRRELLRFSLSILLYSVMIFTFSWIDTMVLGRYAEAGEVGVYSIGVSLSRFINFPIMALSLVLVPVIGELYAKRQTDELKRIYQVLTKWVFSATFPLFFVLFFFPEMTISVIFGERLVGAAVPLRILSLGYIFLTLVGPNASVVAVMGLTGAITRISLAGVVLDLALNYIFVKRVGMGMTGASLATAVSYISVGLAFAVVLYRKSGAHPVTSNIVKPVLSSGVVGSMIYALAKTLPFYSWMVPLYFVLFVVLYAVSLIVTKSIDREDIEMLVAIAKRLGIEPSVIDKLLPCMKRSISGHDGTHG